jgi:hypothetical protein
VILNEGSNSLPNGGVKPTHFVGPFKGGCMPLPGVRAGAIQVGDSPCSRGGQWLRDLSAEQSGKQSKDILQPRGAQHP